ncbi:hypothetical protein ABB37_04039 [Leptomonas pyrrhocoris]|uniref:Uncharacterized protein n=1 Tax=Leptomonas pyrrhocoris TaxID=157538 RepID=A0A0M9G3M6_LEPPY|nr:hypothetical protein ABB37_04039 [Leptomonas pyrrhocoris]KPA81750.1 hypothetical protein ABB37_04039 [Leptomonas pyrrhocoris]|eukprot:XP_015660189.1 hypothetical protein ABB37_04039 [Leptomonas pyrrhocoris]
MDSASGSPLESTAPTRKSRLPQTDLFSESGNHATASSAASPSPLFSPRDGAERLMLPLSSSGPSSAGPAHVLVVSPAEDEESDAGSGELSHMRQLDAALAANARERALHAKEVEVTHLRRTIQELSVQLNNALHTLDARADASAQLQALKDAESAKDERRDDDVRLVRLDMLESRVKYRTMEEELVARYNADVQAKATELLETHTKEVHDENFELLREKVRLAEEVTVGRAAYKELQDSYRKLRRETDLDVGAKQQLLQRSVQQKNQIASLRQQVKTDEDNLNTVVCEYDKKLAEQERRHQAEVNALTKERDDARHDALRLRRDLNQLRSSADNVLSQRSDLEDFFYAALSEVRQRVIEERRQQLARGPLDAANDSKVTAFSPTQTASTVLRLESKGQLLIVGSPGGLPATAAAFASSSSNGNWTVDRKGFPRRGVAATARHGATGAAASVDSPSTPALPPVAATSRAPRSAPPAAPLDNTGTLVAVPSAMPDYLRHDIDAGVASSSSPLNGQCRNGILPGNSPSRLAPAPPSPPAQDLPASHRLPNQLTWKDLKEVDVASLSWADKERVLQLLFKRIQMEGRHRGKAHAKKTAPSAPTCAGKSTVTPPQGDSACFDRDPDSSTFVTQS